MNYTAIYDDPFDQDGTSESGIHVTNEIRLRISSNASMSDEEVKQVLRRHLSGRFKIAKINEEKIRIE